jgi:hypothetical protein
VLLPPPLGRTPAPERPMAHGLVTYCPAQHGGTVQYRTVLREQRSSVCQRPGAGPEQAEAEAEDGGRWTVDGGRRTWTGRTGEGALERHDACMEGCSVLPLQRPPPSTGSDLSPSSRGWQFMEPSALFFMSPVLSCPVLSCPVQEVQYLLSTTSCRPRCSGTLVLGPGGDPPC